MTPPFLFNNRTDIEWSDLREHLEKYNYHVVNAKKDGHCFISSVRECMETDHGVVLTKAEIKTLLTHEIFENNYKYSQYFSGGSIHSMFTSVEKYITSGVYAQEVVDLVIIAAANVLRVNLCIYKNQNNRAILYAQTSDPPSNRDVYLKYSNEHYDAIVAKHRVCSVDDTCEREKRFSEKPTFLHDNQASGLTQEEIDQFAKIGVYFTLSDSATITPQQENDSSVTINNSPPETPETGTFDPSAYILENGVADFNEDLSSHGVRDFNEDLSQQENPDMSPFPENWLGKVPDKYQFEDHCGGDEDAVLDNMSNDDEQNITGDRPQKCGADSVGNESDQTVANEIDETVSNENINSDSMSSFLSDSSSQSSSRRKPEKYQKVKMNEARMAKAEVKEVEEIPWDISGDIVYKVKCTEANYISTYRDGRWFKLKNSDRKGLNGYRKTGTCQGSLICARPDCPKLTAENIVNTIDFKRIGDNMFACNCCGFLVHRVYCGCIKVVEYDKTTGILTYKHQGDHFCTLKPNVSERRKVLSEMPLPLTGTCTALNYQKQCMRYYLDNEDLDAAFEVADAVSEADIIDKIKKLKKYPNKSIHRNDEIDAFGHVNRMQENLLKSDKDKYLIYKWECKAMGQKASYVFKTSAISLKIALMMSGRIKAGDNESILVEEPAYFDGMHSRVKYFVSLTLWVFHPAMRMMMILAIMDTTHENSDDIEIFFDTFNKALASYLSEPEYIWDPYLIMMDEKGANFEAIERVFGPEFRRTKAVTCQWHFMRCAEAYLTKCSEDERRSFRYWCRELCDAHTKAKYKRMSNLIKMMAKKYNFLPWWKWWSPRAPHIVPAIRGFGLPKMNMAEVGQSKLRQDRKVWLSVAVKEDMVALAIQASRYSKFISNQEKIIGRGPTMKQRTQRERAEERRFVDEICDVILTGDLTGEITSENEEDFVPSSRAKHKAPKHDIGIQQRPKKKETEVKKNPSRRGRGFNPRYNNTERPQVQKSPRPIPILDDPHIIVPEEIEKEFIKSNRVYYVLLPKRMQLSTKQVTRCQGCNGPIRVDEKRFPKNFVFRFKMRRLIPPPGGQGKWIMSSDKRNCYFHSRDLACLRLTHELRDIKIEDVYMDNKSFTSLNHENREELKRRDHFDSIIATRNKLAIQGNL